MIRTLSPRQALSALSDTTLKITPYRVTMRDILSLILVLIVGTLLRFYHLEAIDWSKDHSDMAMIAQDIVDGKGIPLVGQPSSAQIPHSPFYVYPLAIPYSFTDDPVIVTRFVAALNVVGIGLLWFLTFRYFGPSVALVTALAYAVNPWAIGYSRTIWSGSHRAPLLILGILLGLLGFLENKKRAQILCFPVLVTALQIHFAGWALFPLYGWLLWIGRKNTTWRILAISLFLGFLVILPFGIGIVNTLTSENARVSKYQPLQRDISFRSVIKPWGQILWLASGLGSEQYSARDNAADLVAQAGQPIILWVFQGAAFILSILVGIWKYSPPQIAIFFLLWVFLPPLAFSIPLVDVAPHYFLPSIAAFCLLVALGVRWIIDWLYDVTPKPIRFLVRNTVMLLFGVIFLTQGLFFINTVRYVETTYLPSQFGSGPPIYYIKRVVSEIQKYQDIVVVTNDNWIDFSRSGSWVWAPFVRDSATCLRDIQASNQVAVFPAKSFAVVFTPLVLENTLLDKLYRTSTPTIIPLRPEEGEYSINSFYQRPNWDGPTLQTITPIQFENGVTLSGFRLVDDRLYLEWALPQKTTKNYDYTLSFIGANGQLLHQEKTTFWAGVNWCADDRLISWLDVDVPNGTNSLRVGMMIAGSAQPVQVSNDAEAAIVLHQ